MRNKISFFLILALVFVLVFSACELNDRREGDYDETADTKISETKPSETRKQGDKDNVCKRNDKGNERYSAARGGDKRISALKNENNLRFIRLFADRNTLR